MITFFLLSKSDYNADLQNILKMSPVSSAEVPETVRFLKKNSLLSRLADFRTISLGLGLLENESTTHFFCREPFIRKNDNAIFEPMRLYLQKARMILS